eukprot:jgi/Chlat1/1142/Chrsp112S01610
MGVQGLLKELRPYQRQCHVSEFAGHRVGVDASCWLHKGAYACALELCEGLPTDAYIRYFLHRVDLLRFHGLIPVIAFDGGRLPLKRNTETTRRQSKSLELGRALLAAGDNAGATCYFQRAAGVSAEMVRGVAGAMRERGVEFVVAPYEADAQLAALARVSEADGGVLAVISEDSDLLAYGVERVLFKMDRDGTGALVELSHIINTTTSTAKSPQSTTTQQHPLDKLPAGALSFAGFTHDTFLAACVLAGCDFLESMPGVGFRTAVKHLRPFKTLEQVLHYMRDRMKPRPSPEYVLGFVKSVLAFRNARIYDWRTQRMAHLSPVPTALREQLENGGDGSRDMDFLGAELDAEVARGVAEGRLDPMTLAPHASTHPTVMPKAARTPRTPPPPSTPAGWPGAGARMKPTHYVVPASTPGASARSNEDVVERGCARERDVVTPAAALCSVAHVARLFTTPASMPSSSRAAEEDSLDHIREPTAATTTTPRMAKQPFNPFKRAREEERTQHCRHDKAEQETTPIERDMQEHADERAEQRDVEPNNIPTMPHATVVVDVDEDEGRDSVDDCVVLGVSRPHQQQPQPQCAVLSPKRRRVTTTMALMTSGTKSSKEESGKRKGKQKVLLLARVKRAVVKPVAAALGIRRFCTPVPTPLRH